MLPFLHRPILKNSHLWWVGIALVCGLAVGWLPLGWAALGLALTVIGLGSLIDIRLALLVLLVMAPLKTLIETELLGAVAWPLDIGQIVFLALVSIWAARHIAVNRRLPVRWTPILAAVMLFTLAAGLSLWTTVSASHTLKELLIWVAILTMIIVTGALTIQQGMGSVVAVLLIAAVVQSLLGIYEFFGGSGAAHLWILNYRYFRAFGSFGQPNPFGSYMGLFLPLAIGTTLGLAADLLPPWTQVGIGHRISQTWLGRRLFRISYEKLSAPRQFHVIMSLFVGALGATLILAAGLIVSWSRGAWLGVGAACLMMLTFMPRRRWLGLGLATAGFTLVILAVLTGLLPESLTQRLTNFTADLTSFTDVRGQIISNENYAVLERFAHWQAALSMASDSPWLGIGFGAYEVAYPRYPLMNWPYALGHAHNYYLNLLAETGIVGLSTYLLLWLVVLALTIHLSNHVRGWQRGVVIGLLGVWTHLLVHSLFDKIYVNNLFLHIGALLGLISGLWLIINQRKNALGEDRDANDVTHVS